MTDSAATLEKDGFIWSPTLLPAKLITTLKEEVSAAQKKRGKPAFRDALSDLPSLAATLQHPAISVLSGLSGKDPILSRALVFDKSPRENWTLRWHQDRTIAVQARHRLTGFHHWTSKDGVPHVTPPSALMCSMIAVRIHLDEADETNGALEVMPGTHQNGFLDAANIQEITGKQRPYIVTGGPGSIFAMRPLLLHRSRRSTVNRPRRVIQLEYGPASLPPPLEWHDAGLFAAGKAPPS